MPKIELRPINSYLNDDIITRLHCIRHKKQGIKEFYELIKNDAELLYNIEHGATWEEVEKYLFNN